MKKLLVIIFVLVILLGWGWWYLGWFSTLQIEEKEMGPYTIVYVNHTGDYKKVGTVMDELYQNLKMAGITQTAGIWIYYDDPATTPTEQLKSEVGSVINPEDISKLKDVGLTYQTKNIEKGTKIVVSFPYKNKLSYFMGPIKVYPLLNTYITEKGYATWNAAIELYDETNKVIYFMIEK